MAKRRRSRTATKSGWRARLGWSKRRIAAKGRLYWIVTSAIFVAWAFGSQYLHDWLDLNDKNPVIFQKILTYASSRSTVPRNVQLALVQDQVYWNELGGRRPIRRDYLATLVDKLTALNAHVIALDFDLRLPDRDKPAIAERYRSETDTLICAIRRAALNGKRVVLSTPLSFDPWPHYRRDPDVYQVYGLCDGKPAYRADCKDEPATGVDDKIAANVACGYIALPYNQIQIPPRLRLKDGKELDSFSLAIARAHRHELVVNAHGDAYPEAFGNFIANDVFRRDAFSLPSDALLKLPARSDRVDSRIVIVGADWSRDFLGGGIKADMHTTPARPMVGAMIHANYVEAVLDSRIYYPLPVRLVIAVEIALGLSVAVMFALLPRRRPKIIALAALCAGLIAAQWILLRDLGVFFDIILPIMGIGIHAVAETDDEARA